MTALVFKLRNVPDDEAQQVRDLLNQHQVEFYETTAGNWGIAMPGIWVQDEEVLRARELIDNYQVTRTQEQRKLYSQATTDGTAATLSARFKQHPFATLGVLLFCVFILYAMLAPFIRLALQ